MKHLKELATTSPPKPVKPHARRFAHDQPRTRSAGKMASAQRRADSRGVEACRCPEPQMPQTARTCDPLET